MKCDYDYNREKDLPLLLSLWPEQLTDGSIDATETIIQKLKQAIRSERISGRSGHWSYNLNRHAALVNALKAEISYLEKQKNKYKMVQIKLRSSLSKAQ